MHVTQQGDDARLIELEGTFFALRPSAEIVSFLFVPADRWPEDVVLHRIVVLEINCRAYLHYENCGLNFSPFWSMTGFSEGAGNVFPTMASTYTTEFPDDTLPSIVPATTLNDVTDRIVSKNTFLMFFLASLVLLRTLGANKQTSI
jgi:hypothetical protein